MRYACLFAAMALVPAWGQIVKPTPGALPPVNAAPAPTASAAMGTPPAPSIGKTANKGEILKILERDFDYQLKMADPKNPLDVLGMTRGLYLQGYGAVFTTEVDLAPSPISPLFHPGKVTDEEKAAAHDRKARHVELLRQQMGSMMAACAKNLDFLGPNDQIVVAVRLLYQGWEDKTGLPDQILMKADRRGVKAGDIKVELQ